MKDQMDDIIFRMVEETFSGINEDNHFAEEEMYFQLKYIAKKKCFLFKNLEIPENLEPFKIFTIAGKVSLQVLPNELYFEDLVLIFNLRPSVFHLESNEEGIILRCQFLDLKEAA